jgi:hypothetical protein
MLIFVFDFRYIGLVPVVAKATSDIRPLANQRTNRGNTSLFEKKQ